NRLLPGVQYKAPLRMEYGNACLHYSFAKSEARIWEKLQTWGHATDFNIQDYFQLWKQAKTDWQALRDFHPTYPIAWPALKPYSREEMQALRHQRPAPRNWMRGLKRRLRRS